MKAKQQAAEKAAKEDGDDNDSCSNTQEPQPQEVPQPADSVVFDGGFFQVESPLKPPGESLTSHDGFLYVGACFISLSRRFGVILYHTFL